MGFEVEWSKDAGFSVHHETGAVHVAALPVPEKTRPVKFVTDKCPECNSLLTPTGKCKRCYARAYYKKQQAKKA